MSYNPFASFNVELPVKYRDSILRYSRSGGNKSSPEFAPFERQVDFWYVAVLFAVAKKLAPTKEADTYNATPATILTTDQYRVPHLQLAVLGLTNDLTLLSDSRRMFDYVNDLACSGIPYLLAILEDPDDRPLPALMTELENISKARERLIK